MAGLPAASEYQRRTALTLLPTDTPSALSSAQYARCTNAGMTMCADGGSSQSRCCEKQLQYESYASITICLTEPCRTCMWQYTFAMTSGAYLPNQHVNDLHCNTAGLQYCRKPWGVCGCRPAHHPHVLATERALSNGSMHNTGRINTQHVTRQWTLQKCVNT